MPITPEGKTQVSLQLNDDVVRAVEQYRFKRQFESKVAAFENLLRYAVKANPPKPEESK